MSDDLENSPLTLQLSSFSSENVIHRPPSLPVSQPFHTLRCQGRKLGTQTIPCKMAKLYLVKWHMSTLDLSTSKRKKKKV